jgi:uncharacterized protein (UPF0276 family)
MSLLNAKPHSVAAAAARDPLAALPKLGVGLLYNPALGDFLPSNLQAVDFIEIIPDMFRTDQGRGQTPRFVELESWIEVLDWLLTHLPVIAHNIGLSIATSDLFDIEYVQELARWQQRCRFPWHSDHLSFVQVHTADGHEHSTGMAVPVPYDLEVFEMIAQRVEDVQRSVPIPFLLENNVFYVNILEQELSEPEFLNRLTARTGCGILLDIHNVYANARNHGFDSRADFIDQLDLTRVVELHIAGGNELAGMYTDSHAGPCPEPVWELLEHVVPRTPNLRAITFEFHESYYPLLGDNGILEQLARARDAWKHLR